MSHALFNILRLIEVSPTLCLVVFRGPNPPPFAVLQRGSPQRVLNTALTEWIKRGTDFHDLRYLPASDLSGVTLSPDEMWAVARHTILALVELSDPALIVQRLDALTQEVQ